MSAPFRPALRLYDYQQNWFKDKSRFKLGLFARQTGKTFTTTAEIVDGCFEALLTGRRERWVILSRGERQAKEAMDEGVKRHAQAYGVGFEALDYDWVANEASYKAQEVVLAGGSRITALPANPDTARGFSANVFLDEFAFHKDSRSIWKALFPVISAGHDLRVVSTPNGKGNKFYELVTGSDEIWSRHRVDIHQAVAGGLVRDIAAMKAALNDDDAWDQEFELKFLDEASAWLSYDLITACEDDKAGFREGYQGGPCFIGNDIAARNDLWVAWVMELVGDVLWTREIRVERRIPFSTQDAIIDELMEHYDVVRLAMDQTGMGEKPVQDAQKRYGMHKVEGVMFSAPRKLALATAGKQRFEDRTIRIPMGDPALRSDLHKLKKITGETGHPRLVADRDVEGHADRTWAGFLAVGAASNPHEDAAGETVAADREALRARRPDPVDRGLEQLLAGGAGQMFQRRPSGLFTRRGSTGER